MLNFIENEFGELEYTSTLGCTVEISPKAPRPGIVIESLNSQKELENIFDSVSKYHFRWFRLTFSLDDLKINFSDIPSVLNFDSIEMSFLEKNISLNLLPESKKLPLFNKIKEFILVSQYSIEFDQYLALTNLKRLVVQYHKKSSSWLEHEGIIDLTIHKYKADDLTTLSKMKSLKRLKLVQGSVKSLNGIENLKNLETLHIHSVRNLTDLTSLLKSTSIENLVLEAYSKVIDLGFLSEMKQLKLVRLKEAKSIHFLNELPNILFAGIEKVQDKDNSPQNNIHEKMESSGLSDEQYSKAFGRIVDVFGDD